MLEKLQYVLKAARGPFVVKPALYGTRRGFQVLCQRGSLFLVAVSERWAVRLA